MSWPFDSQEMLDFEKVAAEHMALNLENPTGHYALRLVGHLSCWKISEHRVLLAGSVTWAR